jgi:hypothetical protein
MNLLIVSLAALATCSMATASLAQVPARSCVRIEVSSGASAAPVTRSALVPTLPSFSATKVLDLTFTVLFPAATNGEHLVELRVFTPDSQLCRSMAMPVARNALPNAARQVEGYPRPLAQQNLRPVSRGRSLFTAASTTLPVGGTDIVSSGLYGRWRLEAYLDGAEQACAPAAWFTLKP